jgi:hypothetical protein
VDRHGAFHDGRAVQVLDAAPAWLAAPDDPPAALAVDVASFVDVALEAEAWALDARLARAEAAA